MKNTFSVRWHSRAGQGAITAATALAEILGSHGKFVQSFPDFGAEKRGASVIVFNRIAKNPITDISHPREVDLVALLDSSLVASCEITPVEVLSGLTPNGKLLVNVDQNKVDFASNQKNVFTLDASAIAITEIGRDIPNVPMLGALIRITALAELKSFLVDLKNYLARGLPEKIVTGNLRAFERGYGEIRKVN